MATFVEATPLRGNNHITLNADVHRAILQQWLGMSLRNDSKPHVHRIIYDAATGNVTICISDMPAPAPKKSPPSAPESDDDFADIDTENMGPR